MPEERVPTQTILLAVAPMAAGLDVSPGLIQATAISGAAQGPGRDGGAGRVSAAAAEITTAAGLARDTFADSAMVRSGREAMCRARCSSAR